MIKLLNSDEKDERFGGVILLDSDEDSKRTAEDCGLWWYIRTWEISLIDDAKYWYCDSSFTISKSNIKLLGSIK